MTEIKNGLLGSHAQDPTLQPQPFEHVLGVFVDKFPQLSPTIRDAYSASTDALYVDPAVNPDAADQLDAARRKTLLEFVNDYDYAITQNFSAPLIQGQPRRNRRAMEYNRSSGHSATVMRALMANDDSKVVINHVYETKGSGIVRSDFVYVVSSLNYAQYTPETSFSPEKTVEDSIYCSYARAAFGEDRDPASINDRELIQKLRELDVLDSSKKMLDKRFEHFLALVQLETSALFLTDARLLADVGGGVRQSRLLVAKYKDDLLLDDYDQKLEMMDELASVLRHAFTRERDTKVRDFLRVLASRARTTADDIRGYVQGFTQAYKHLGYELPPELAPVELAQNPQAMARIERVPQNIGRDTQSHMALITEIAEHSQNLHERMESFISDWTLSGKERRDMRLGVMMRELIRGFTNFAGQELLPGMVKQEAQRITDCIVMLNAKALEGENARETLEASIKLERAIDEDNELVRLVATEAGIPVMLPRSAQIGEYVNLLRGEWTSFKQLILKTWPDYEGAAVAARLEELLFESPEANTDDPYTAEIALLQAQVAEQLDKIILPPGANKEDIQRELTRLGAAHTALKPIEWERLSGLIEICNKFGGTFFKSKEHSLGASPPYFVVLIEINGEKIAIAESPMFGNATYIVPEKQAAGTWLEVLELTKTDARSVGAHRVIHPKKGAQQLGRHVDKLYDVILATTMPIS